MAIKITDRRMTLEEFLDLPERKPALEYEDGRITQKVPPKGRHSALQADTVEVFNRFGRPRKLARAFTELRTTYANASLVPDVAVYLWERIPRDDRGRVADDFREVPDIVVEIVSPKQSVNALIQRCLRFLERGAHAALLVHPDDESVRLFRPGQAMATLRGADPIDLHAILPGFELTVQDLFDSLLV